MPEIPALVVVLPMAKASHPISQVRHDPLNAPENKFVPIRRHQLQQPAMHEFVVDEGIVCEELAKLRFL